MSEERQVLINGRPQPYRPQTLHDLLLSFDFDPEQPGIAMAVNAEVVRRGEWRMRILQPGDRVEIVQARAGG